MTSTWVNFFHNLTGIVNKCISPTYDKCHGGSSALGYGFAFFSGMTVGIALVKLNDYQKKKEKEEQQPRQKEKDKEEQQIQQKEKEKEQEKQDETSSTLKYGVVAGLAFGAGAFCYNWFKSERKPENNQTTIIVNTKDVGQPGTSSETDQLALQSADQLNDHSSSNTENREANKTEEINNGNENAATVDELLKTKIVQSAESSKETDSDEKSEDKN